MTFVIDVSPLKSMHQFVTALPERAAQASVLAVSAALNFGYAESSRQIRSQLNLPQSYIGSAASGNRLKIKQRPVPGNPLGVIAASPKPVSLARFALDRTLGGRKGVSVQVKPGSTRRIGSAFLLKLKSGRQISEDQFNIGLAIRLKPGQTVFNKKKLRQLSPDDADLYLVYGPSVDQAFKSVRSQVEPQISAYMQKEFLRQFSR
jgi:hypothetical protein